MVVRQNWLSFETFYDQNNRSNLSSNVFIPFERSLLTEGNITLVDSTMSPMS